MLFPLGPDFKPFTKNDQENTYANLPVDSNTGWQGFRVLPNITAVLIEAFCVYFADETDIYRRGTCIETEVQCQST